MKQQDFAELVCSVVSIPNPQHLVGGEPGEAALASWICSWLAERDIPHECDLAWGVHAVLTGPDGAGEPGMLLEAHMDSDHLSIPDLKHLRIDGTVLRCQGQVGLDCKTGIAIALSVLDSLRQGAAGAWQVHALFTVGEESGQKGAIRAPLPRLLAGKVRCGLVIDRMTSGRGCPHDASGKPMRHAVNMYKGVPLLEPQSGPELLAHLSAAIGQPVPLVESPNCSDAIELRGRWDAEILAPTCGEPTATLEAALDRYRDATNEVVRMMARCAPAERACGMSQHPRLTRYHAMRAVYDALHSGKTALGDPRLAFSVLNLSYDYDDAWAECDLGELYETAKIVLRTCKGVCGRVSCD